MNRLLSILIIIILAPSTALADFDLGRADSHAPIGVMGEHLHKEGELMLSYRYMFMDMDGNRDGSRSVSTADVLEDFPVTPTDMDMEMHMLGAMFAPNDKVTLMAMIPYTVLSMNHETRMGQKFETKADGLGDLKLSGLVLLHENNNHKVHLNAGVSLPTGEIDARDDTPAMADAQLPYPMQLGSGTFDLMPGVTYAGQAERFSWGAQALGTIRPGRNDNSYALGNRFETSIWGAMQVINGFSASIRTKWSKWGNISGADPELNPNMVSTADPDRRGGQQLDLGLGVNTLFKVADTPTRWALEFLIPLARDLDGPQLETDFQLITGFQLTL